MYFVDIDLTGMVGEAGQPRASMIAYNLRRARRAPGSSASRVASTQRGDQLRLSAETWYDLWRVLTKYLPKYDVLMGPEFRLEIYQMFDEGAISDRTEA